MWRCFSERRCLQSDTSHRVRSQMHRLLNAQQMCLLLSSQNKTHFDGTTCQHDPLFHARFVLFVDALHGTRDGVSGCVCVLVTGGGICI